MCTKEYVCTHSPFYGIGPCFNSYTEEKSRLMFKIFGKILLCLMTLAFSKVGKIVTVCHYTTKFYVTKFYKNKI